MTVEINTPHRAYPLPHQSNLLEQDVLRLISAIVKIDEDMAEQLQAITSQQQALGTQQQKFEQHKSDSAEALAAIIQTMSEQRAEHSELHRKQKINHLLGESLYPL
ncbi:MULTISPECIES: hypothetical protein [Pseudoalteromonas]|uniref:Uncharacterized protein n=1 Tax=Pseudoalteromonas amylolytica TaxID=1859457 RepID=A0A1S1MW84_9GAMM|nr:MULTISPECIES: hypothetical protein [Pseudoalteromonas]OHU87833.1 hypothetical protein BFC16_10490 [Pseudoalteromonas sp. JW3]OHU91273.1 hypothetical protein BET10_10610 [Pseudoalteromonas amylolytica]